MPRDIRMLKYVSLMLFLNLMGTHAFASVGQAYRPVEVQNEVDRAFERLSEEFGGWLYNGNGFYRLMGFDEKKIIMNLVTRNHSKKDIYLMDVGAASGGWSRDVEAFVQKELSDCGKHFHIFSLTGVEELKDEVITSGNVTHYRMNQFKVENIGSELAKRGHNLVGKIDLMVSDWTLRHLVDPFGTLEEMYGLLSSQDGVLLSNGFIFTLDDSEKVSIKNKFGGILSTRDGWNLFSLSSAQYVLRSWDPGRDADQFMLIRTQDRPLNLPLDYTAKVQTVGSGYQIASMRVCGYQLTAPLKDANKQTWASINGSYYGDASSHATYEKFKLEDWLHTWE